MRVAGVSASLFAHRDMRLFLGAQGLDALAIGVASVALPWLLLKEGYSAALAGLIYPLTIVPYLVFGLLAGSIGDRFSWRKVMYVSHAVQALASASIPLSAIAGPPPLPLVLIAAFMVGSGRVFADAAAFGAVASVVGPENFVRGQSALSAVWSVGFLAGPALAGLLIAAIGPAFALVAEAAGLVVAAGLTVAVRSGGKTGPATSTDRQGLRSGLLFIRGDPVVRVFTLANLSFAFVTAGAFGLQVPLLRNAVGLSSAETGVVLAIGAVAGTGSSLAAGRLAGRFGSVVVCLTAMGLAAVTLAGLAVVEHLPVAAVAIAAYSGLSWLLSTMFISERQSRASTELQSRVGIAGRMLMLGAATIGSVLATGLAGVIGVRAVYLAMAIAAAGVTLLIGPPLAHRTRMLVKHPAAAET